MDKKLSIIIPVFNERESLSTMVRLLKSSLDFEKERDIFENFNKLSAQELSNYNDVIDETKHSLEISNWLGLSI